MNSNNPFFVAPSDRDELLKEIAERRAEYLAMASQPAHCVITPDREGGGMRNPFEELSVLNLVHERRLQLKEKGISGSITLSQRQFDLLKRETEDVTGKMVLDKGVLRSGYAGEIAGLGFYVAREGEPHHMHCQVCGVIFGLSKCPVCGDPKMPSQPADCTMTEEEEEIQPKRPAPEKYAKYRKDVRHLDSIDVYETHRLYAIDDPSGCIQHASKKLLLSGVRTGGKSKQKDIEEARDTLNRWLEMNDAE